MNRGVWVRPLRTILVTIIVLAVLGWYIQSAMAAQASILVHISRADSMHDARTGRAILQVTLDQDSARAFEEFAKAHIGLPAEMRLNGKVVAAPVIREPIIGPSMQIDFEQGFEKANELAQQIMAANRRMEIIARE